VFSEIGPRDARRGAPLLSDCGNQLLLLSACARRGSRRREAIRSATGRRGLLWCHGGATSLSEAAFLRLRGHPQDHERPSPSSTCWIGVGILAVSLVLEGASCLSNPRELDKRRGEKAFMKISRDNETDSDLSSSSRQKLGGGARPHVRAPPRSRALRTTGDDAGTAPAASRSGSSVGVRRLPRDLK